MIIAKALTKNDAATGGIIAEADLVFDPLDTFLEAAKKPHREPVVLVAIESAAAIRVVYGSSEQWGVPKSVSNCNRATIPGSVFLQTNVAGRPYPGTYTETMTPNTTATGVNNALYASPQEGSPYLDFSLNQRWNVGANTAQVQTHARTDNVTLTVVTKHKIHDSNSWMVAYGNIEYTVWGINGGGSPQALSTGTIVAPGAGGQFFGTKYYNNYYDPTTVISVNLPSIGDWKIYVSLDALIIRDPSTGLYSFAPYDPPSLTLQSLVCRYSVQYLTPGTIQTQTMDLGLVPTIPSIFTVDDVIPYGTSLTYTARGSNDGGTWTNLGTVVDGSSLAAYRYYDVTATLSTTAPASESPRLDEIRISGGNSQFEYLSTHHNIPVQGALPYVIPGSIGTLTTKIERDKVPSTGEASVKLFWTSHIADLIATGRVKNKAISIKIGFVDIPEDEYQPYFTGTIQDWSLNHEKGELTVKTRDVWKQLDTDLPRETVDGSGNKTTTPWVKSGVNVIQVMLDIIDYIGIPDRYIDRPAFQALRDGARSGSSWAVTRTITEPTEGKKLMGELGVSAGVFLVPLPEGKLVPLLYDPTASPVTRLSTDICTFKQVEGNLKETATRQIIYYSLTSGKSGSSSSDFTKAHLKINATAETEMGEVAEKEWKDLWGMSNTAIAELADRWDSWYAFPKMSVKAEGIPPRLFQSLQAGAAVLVDGLPVPMPRAAWSSGTTYAARAVIAYSGRSYRSLQAANTNHQPDSSPTWWEDMKILNGKTSQKRFLVTSRSLDPKKISLTVELLEM